MSTASFDDRTGGESQRQRWEDTRQYLDGAMDVEEYEERERAYEPDYESVMLALARSSYSAEGKTGGKLDLR